MHRSIFESYTTIRPVLEAVANRMIPEDAWPSATANDTLNYLKLHFNEDTDTWMNLIEPGLRALDEEAIVRYQQSFATLSYRHQDGLLQDVETDHVADWPISAKRFFSTLLELVSEGYYGSSDAGGNLGGKSWDMIGFRAGPALDMNAPVQETEPVQLSFDEIRDSYDAVVVGGGAGGSVAAAVLAESGFRVLLVERGRWLRYGEVGANHVRNHRFSRYGHNTGPSEKGNPRTLLLSDDRETTTQPHESGYHNNAMTLGGGTRVYGAQAWRFHPDDFRMATRYGVPDGSSLADWPIDYNELEPYYTKAEWEVGVSGDESAHMGRGGRSRPYPMPPLSRTLEADFLAQAANRLGWDVGPVPLLINSVHRDGRPACARCGQCVGFACPTNSKNGGHNTMLLHALATGNCDLLCETMVERIDTEHGSHATGVRLVHEANGRVRRRQVRAGHVIVAAGAIESARLLLHSATVDEPNGVGNRHDQVGRNLQGHVYTGAYALFDDAVQDGLGPGVSIATCRFAHDNGNGVIGGGMLANEFTRLPIIHWYRALPPDAVRWGQAGKDFMRESYLRTAHVQGPIQEIPTPDARVRLSQAVKDHFGMPVAQLSGNVHPESLRTAAMLAERAEMWLSAAGAKQIWRARPSGGLSAGQHQAGTLRMGNDPLSSVTDPFGRIHGYDNLWVSDGSVHVTNGGVNPVLTILALAFRTAENIVKEA